MHRSALMSLLTNFSNEPADLFVDVLPGRLNDSADADVAEAPMPPSPFVRWDEEPKAVDIDALVAAARQEERSAAAAELKQRLAEQAEQHRQATAKLLKRERAGWIKAQAQPIAAGFVDAVAAMEQRLGAQLERILTPFLQDAARAACLDAFAASVAEIYAACPKGTVRLRGPRDLVKAIGTQLSQLGVPLVGEPADTIELAAIIGDTVMETCLEAFAAALGVAAASRPCALADPLADPRQADDASADPRPRATGSASTGEA